MIEEKEREENQKEGYHVERGTEEKRERERK